MFVKLKPGHPNNGPVSNNPIYVNTDNIRSITFKNGLIMVMFVGEEDTTYYSGMTEEEFSKLIKQ
jgi:hypothetical protein